MDFEFRFRTLCYLALIFYPLVTGSKVEAEEDDPIDYLDAMQIIRKYGYPAEAHTIETKDGYLLQVHRIPHGKQRSSSTRKPPVFMQHGLFCSSEDFLLTGPNNSLPFLLADLGFDVWLGNIRGNPYSRAHVSISPSQIEFWNFTWHECAVQDVSAQIDFICNHTNQEKLIYVGHSMGTTMFFVLMSTHPEYGQKVAGSLLMAPVAYMKNVRSLFLRFLASISTEYMVVAKLLGDGEFLPDGKLVTYLANIICKPLKIGMKLCLNIVYLIVGSNPDDYDKNVMELMLNHFSAGFSVKGVNHYAQLVKSGKFRNYDYGKSGNLLEYGSSKPPDYNLKTVNVSTYLYVGQNDLLSTVADVKRLAKQLPGLKNVYLVDYPKFSHLDFLIGKDLNRQLFGKMIKDLRSFLPG